MFDFIYSNLKNGVLKVRSNPQLVYTIIIATVIVLAFVFMAERFVGIANDAQERLINVRIGSLQDAFVSFAGDKITDTEYLNEKITDVTRANETIKSFRVIRKMASGGDETHSADYVIAASNDASEVGELDSQAGFLYTLASSDPFNSVTIELQNNNERFFKTARAISDESGNILGVA